jgi:hypothetical protein
MSNAVTTSSINTSMAPVGDGVSLFFIYFEELLRKYMRFRQQLMLENFHHVNNVIVK